MNGEDWTVVGIVVFIIVYCILWHFNVQIPYPY